MAITRLGLTGPMAAYPGFTSKAPISVIYSTHVANMDAEGPSVTGLTSTGPTVTGSEDR